MPESEMPVVVTATEIIQYGRHNCCERRFTLAFNKKAQARRLPFHDSLFSSMDVVTRIGEGGRGPMGEDAEGRKGLLQHQRGRRS